jgi:predicted PurR-regulated permease PerM
LTLTPRQRQTLTWSLVAVALLWALVVLRPVVTPFLAAAILAYGLQPGVQWLSGHGVRRSLGAVLMMVLALLCIVAVLLVLVPIVQTEIGQIRQRLPGLAQAITERLLPWLHDTLGLDIRLNGAEIRAWLARQLSSAGEDWAALLFGYVRSGWSAAIEAAGLVFLVPVLGFYLLLDWPDLMTRLRALVPPRWRTGVFEVAGEIDTLLGQYVRGQGLVMLSLAAFYSAGLLLAGYSLWLPIGVLSGLLVAIPYLGFALGLVFALVTGMLELGPLHGLVATAVIYGTGQVLESVVLTPRLVGERIGLHPLAVIFALMAFGTLLGFAGVLLALPLAAMASVGARRLHAAYLDSEFFRRES